MQSHSLCHTCELETTFLQRGQPNDGMCTRMHMGSRIDMRPNRWICTRNYAHEMHPVPYMEIKHALHVHSCVHTHACSHTMYMHGLRQISSPAHRCVHVGYSHTYPDIRVQQHHPECGSKALPMSQRGSLRGTRGRE